MFKANQAGAGGLGSGIHPPPWASPPPLPFPCLDRSLSPSPTILLAGQTWPAQTWCRGAALKTGIPVISISGGGGGLWNRFLWIWWHACTFTHQCPINDAWETKARSSSGVRMCSCWSHSLWPCAEAADPFPHHSTAITGGADYCVLGF